jgi:hypothetical protein
MRCGPFTAKKSTQVIEKEEDDCRMRVGNMEEMLEAIETNILEDPPITEVDAFFKLLKASEESMHEYIEVTLLAFITHL